VKIVKVGLLALLPLFAGPVLAGDLTTDAAIGGAIGGALGGAVGAEVGGRQGAIVGAGVGAAAGTAINTKDHVETRDRHYEEPRYEEHHHYHERDSRRGHCPPGQAKKGNC
jgi:hypothetical protein